MRKILVPTDFSAVADRAVQFAIAMNKNVASEFLFFHAGKSDTEELRERINSANNHQPGLENQQVKYIAADIDFNVDAVIQLIKEHGINLIVMGTHGDRTPLTPNIFGSNTSAVMESSGIPVIAVPPNHVFKGISRIAYAADFINFEGELEKVIAFAKTVNGAIEVFHVAPVFPDFGTEKTNADAIIEKAREKYNFPYIRYHLEETPRDNQIVKGIHNFLEEHPSDLLIIFHANRSWLDKLVAPSAAVKEVIHIKLPIMVFPKIIPNT